MTPYRCPCGAPVQVPYSWCPKCVEAASQKGDPSLSTVGQPAGGRGGAINGGEKAGGGGGGGGGTAVDYIPAHRGGQEKATPVATLRNSNVG
jgi:hypothetical protein